MLSPNTLFFFFLFSFSVLKVNVTKIGKETKLGLKREKKEIGGTGLVGNEQYESRKEG